VKDGSLLRNIPWFAKSVAERPAQVQEARSVSRDSNFLNQR
jgi:hypothetical protein